MRHNTFFAIALFCAVVAAASFTGHRPVVLAAPLHDDVVKLITEDEASQPDQRIVKGSARTPERSDGPTLEFVSPVDGTTVPKPLEINVNFKPNGSPVKLDSLKVSYLKLFSIDITDRVRPYATAEGIHIKAADLPTGSHRVKFTLEDEQARVSEHTMSVTIE